MTTAFQPNAFQNNAFQIDVAAQATIDQGVVDLDKSGYPVPRYDAFLGPSLGKVLELVKPQIYITNSGIYTIASACVLLVVAGGAVTVILPDVRVWMKQPLQRPTTAFERSIWIKDYGGNASNFNITVTPFGTQTIDGLAGNFVIVSNRFLMRLYPLNDLSGWYVA